MWPATQAQRSPCTFSGFRLDPFLTHWSKSVFILMSKICLSVPPHMDVLSILATNFSSFRTLTSSAEEHLTTGYPSEQHPDQHNILMSHWISLGTKLASKSPNFKLQVEKSPIQLVVILLSGDDSITLCRYFVCSSPLMNYNMSQCWVFWMTFIIMNFQSEYLILLLVYLFKLFLRLFLFLVLYLKGVWFSCWIFSAINTYWLP